MFTKFKSIFRSVKAKPNEDFILFIKKHIIRLLELPDDYELDENKKLVDLGFDSIKFIDLLLQIENNFEISFDSIVQSIDVAKISTVNDLIEIGSLLDKK